MVKMHRCGRCLVSFLLTLSVVVTFIPVGASAGELSFKDTSMTRKYLVHDDGTQTPISDAEYERLKNSGELVPEEEGDEVPLTMDKNTLIKTSRPTYNGVFEVYSKYFNYYPYDLSGSNKEDDLYLEYSSDGGRHWKRSGYMRFNWITLATQQGYKISGLKPDTTYKTRIRYGEDGPVKNTTTIKTGKAKKPEVKSIRAKAVKVKYHKVKHYGKYTGAYLYTEKFYTYKIKVTVRLKKRPGTKGIFLGCSNGVGGSVAWLKGNKKTYTKTFSPYPNYSSKHPKRRVKVVVALQSAQNKSWGGYSPIAKKNLKLS